MFSTTLRIPDPLASFLQEEAKAHNLSVNAYLTRLLEADREEGRRRRLAQDWVAYAADLSDQDVAYALPAQAAIAAEPYVPFGDEP